MIYDRGYAIERIRYRGYGTEEREDKKQRICDRGYVIERIRYRGYGTEEGEDKR